jgi:hypothetical protein
MRRQSAMAPRWQRGNRQEDTLTNNNINNKNNQTFALIFFASFLYDTKVTSTTNEMAIRTRR